MMIDLFLLLLPYFLSIVRLPGYPIHFQVLIVIKVSDIMDLIHCIHFLSSMPIVGPLDREN